MTGFLELTGQSRCQLDFNKTLFYEVHENNIFLIIILGEIMIENDE